MSGYDLLKFLHIAAVIAWVGGAIGITVLQARIGAAGDRPALLSIGRQMDRFGKTYYAPLAILTLVTGAWMVVRSWDFEDPWIVIGIVGVLVSIAIGLGLISPTGRKLVAESENPEPNFGAIASYSKRIRALGLTNLALLMFVVWVMVAKPGS
jgi:uncharacterized membrane protein